MLTHMGYSAKAFKSQEKMISDAEKDLAGVDFDTMIGTGLSGSVAIPVLAMFMNKKFAIIRKNGDNSHSGAVFEGAIGNRWLFVDDFISSGDTLSNVVHRLMTIFRYQPDQSTTFVGAYEYERNNFRFAADLSYITSRLKKRISSWKSRLLCV